MVSFDIRDALLERGYPTGKVQIWVSDEIFYKIDAVTHEHAETVNKTKLRELDDRLKQLERERDEQAYLAHLRGISIRAGEDIVSKALAEWPIRRDMYGREDDAVTLERTKFMRELQLAAHLTKLVNPDGIEQVLTDKSEEERREIARAILADAPRVTLNILDQAMGQLSKDFAEQTQKFQDPDFLSKH